MWTRQLLKTNAKNVLRLNYWKALGISVVAALLMGGLNFTYSIPQRAMTDGSYVSEAFRMYGWAIVLASFVALAVGIVFRLFVQLPVEAGENRFFMENRVGNAPFASLFSVFGNATYLNVVKVLFMRDLFIALWSLLFVIPGIVKSYQYRMVGYIIAENPNLTWREALDLSRQMTNGEKGEIFVLDLSFIGWYLLGALACGVGTIFVMPYYQATNAELYAAMRAKALTNGWVTEQILSDFVRY